MSSCVRVMSRRYFLVVVSMVLSALRLSTGNVAAIDNVHIASVKVAQCRAQCLDKFTWAGWTPSDTLCKEEADCYMCWDSCDLLNQNFAVWGSMCDHNDICFPGCQQACGYYIQGVEKGISTATTSLRFTKPIEFAHRLATNSLILSWQRPEGATPAGENSVDNNNVYVVLRRTRLTGEITKWQQVAQTSELATALDMNTLAPSSTVDFKVAAVTGSGMAGQLVTSYVSGGVVMAQDEKASIQMAPAVIVGEPISMPEEQQQQVVTKWRLHLAALRHNAKLGSVDAVITWAAPGLTGNFLVTWEVKEGTFAITGHLYTDSTTVSLTLWPDTVYSVQVELVSSTLEKALRSEPLTVDTNVAGGHHAKMAATDGEEDVTMVVAAASDKECTNTLVIASFAVGTSLLLVLFGLVILCRRFRRKNAVECAGSTTLRAGADDAESGNSQQRPCGAVNRKLSSLPALMPVDHESGLSHSGTTPVPPHSSSSSDDRLSAFRAFLENVERMTESLSPRSDSGSVFPALSQQNISGSHDATEGNCNSAFVCSRQLRQSREILLSNVQEDDGLCSVFESSWSPPCTEKLLKDKMKIRRSMSTAI